MVSSVDPSRFGETRINSPAEMLEFFNDTHPVPGEQLSVDPDVTKSPSSLDDNLSSYKGTSLEHIVDEEELNIVPGID